MAQLNFRNQTVLITDASTLISRELATLFAHRGANLVLNYPSDHAGSRLSLGTRDNVYEISEISEKAEEIVGAAISRYGSLHILINTSTFRSGGPPDNLSATETWSLLRQLEIDGSYRYAKAAWPHLRKQKFGRIIQTGSLPTGTGVAEITARFAIFGLMQTLVREGSKYNITFNILSAPGFDPILKGGRQEARTSPVSTIASVAAILSHRSTQPLSGAILECGDSSVSRLRWERGSGLLLNPEVGFTSGVLRREWTRMDDFSASTFSTAPADMGSMIKKAQLQPANELTELLQFDGKVVIVTGAASGLGRVYAIAFAELGAAVVASDRSDPQKLVEEIQHRGGEAMGVIGSVVEDAAKIVQAAVMKYGHVDILINNAGFLRDKSFVKMDKATWDVILDVHLQGTYNMTQAIWPYFSKQGSGKIVNTTSTSGLYGVFGQANYSAAKLGILGLSYATAIEGSNHNIQVNTIAPVASTALLLASLPPEDQNNQGAFRPEYVAPLVLLLSSGDSRETGGLFEVACGWHARTRLTRSVVQKLPAVPKQSPESIVQIWKHIENDASRTAPLSIPKRSDTTLDNIKAAKQEEIARTEYTFSEENVILYNLAIGAQRASISLIYEKHPSFWPLPTFGLIPFFSPEVINHHATILPNFSTRSSLLAEHYLEILTPRLPTTGTLISSGRVLQVVDKQIATLTITSYTTTDPTTHKAIFHNEVTFFTRGTGGFGGDKTIQPRGDATRTNTPPDRKPDHVAEHHTSPEQAALYRLTGDKTGVHVDPASSSEAGFPQPILHGACTMGIAGRLIWERFGEFRSIKARFVGVVVPGQTLRVEMWKEEDEGASVLGWDAPNYVVYRVTVAETEQPAITGGAVRLRAGGSGVVEGGGSGKGARL